MRRAHSLRSNAIVGLVTVLVITVFTVAAFRKDSPFDRPFEVRAAFSTANDVKAGSPVRIAGVEVGEVKAVEPLEGEPSGAVVVMEVKDEGLPLHRDATFKVRPRIFLEGNYFVDLRPGSPAAPVLEDGDLVPVTQTKAPVQLGQVLEALQTDTREDLQLTLQRLGRSLDGGGAKGFNRSIDHWYEASRFSAEVNDALLGRLRNDLSGYVRGAAKVAEGLDRDPQALKGLITDFATTANAFASEQRNLAAAIDELPRTLRIARSALGRLNEAFPPLRRFVAELRPTVRSSGPALDAQLPLVRQLRGLVDERELRGLAADLRRTVPSLTALTRDGVPLQEQQRLLSSCQTNVVLPWQEDEIDDPNFKSAGKVYQEGVKWLPGISGESRSFDAHGQYVRSLADPPNFAYPLGDGRLLLTGDPLLGVNPPRAPQPELRDDVPCETQERPDLRTIPQEPPRAIRINQNAPGAAERRAKADRRLRKWMRDVVKARGLEDVLEVVAEPLTRGEIDDVVRGLGREAP